MKQLGWKWGAVAILAVTPVLTLTAAVRTDFDTRANFGQYRTFAWREADAGKGAGNSLVDARIRDNAAAQLAARGMRENDENPDAILTFRVEADTERTRTLVPSFGYGSMYRPMYRPFSRYSPYYRPMHRRPYFGLGGGARWGYPDPFWGMGGGLGGARVIENEYVAGRILLEMVDARTNQVIWRADVTSTGDSVFDVQSEKSIAKAMKDAFKKFPRKS